LDEDASQTCGAFQNQTTDAGMTATTRQCVQRCSGVLRITDLDFPPKRRVPRDLPKTSTCLRQSAAITRVEPAENPQQQIIIKLAEVTNGMMYQVLGL